MNYFAHGRPFRDDPYLLAGTAVPDWLGVFDRRVRVREKHAARFVEVPDAELAALARGIVQHHQDDAWFHNTRAFAELAIELTVLVRDALPPDPGFRPSFLGHILVELLLDAALIEAFPDDLADYYRSLEKIDADLVQQAVGQISQLAPQRRRPERLTDMIEGFRQSRFLYDYLDDGKLLYRLNQVLSRVRLSPLPKDFPAVLGEARARVYPRRDELLTPPANQGVR